MSLSGKVAIVTGGTKGIGLAAALTLRSLGASVVVTYGSDTAAAEDAVKALGGSEHSLAVRSDAGNIADIQKLVDAVVAKFKKIDIVINNAALMTSEAPSDITEESYDRAFNTNVKGPLFLTKLAIPHISDGGRIIFISTSLTAASAILPKYALYVSTKGAIEQFSRTAAKEYGAKGITVNTISPGPTETDLFINGNSDQSIGMIKNLTPAKRLGQPDDIAKVLAFIASPDSAWINGQTIKVNGGFVV
ncbi:Sps19p [Sugiyamaella lignohabitans]|uniref:Sps19p n=1 Tax=Sugiyamaella lignohabitans TaxID=796027 RepID=A0A167FRV3_9ASCO|nr:Sps19p [Sugiyamaella lignohabitans]ANB15623.1 Sps19p [Sugiyamaella lignohabitans]